MATENRQIFRYVMRVSYSNLQVQESLPVYKFDLVLAFNGNFLPFDGVEVFSVFVCLFPSFLFIYTGSKFGSSILGRPVSKCVCN